MTTTTEALPMRPRGAARLAANAAAARAANAAGARAVVPETTGAAVSPPAAPVSTDTLPSRRSLRRSTRASRRADAGRSLARAVSRATIGPVRSVGSAVASAEARPVTATAVVACLLVSVATPHAATASTPQGMPSTLPAQQYATAARATIVVERDAFRIGTDQVRPPTGAAAADQAHPAVAVRPADGSVPAAGGFGSRWVRGCAACSTNHQGLDFSAPTGTAVVAAMPGRVVAAGVLGGYGNQVLLLHADGTQTRYGHLSQIGVRVGDTLAAGQRLGAVGNTGVSTGSHLHFEVILGGTPVDPAAWLRSRGLL